MLRQIKMKREQLKSLEEMNREETRWNHRWENRLNQKIEKKIQEKHRKKLLGHILDTT